MKLEYLFFALLLLMWLALAATWLVPQHEHAKGMIHPQHKAMAHGGDGAVRHKPLFFLGWTLGAVQIVIFGVVLTFGIRRDRLRGLIVPLVLGAALQLVVFSAMFLAYRGFLSAAEADEVAFLGPLPLPTTLMIVAVWVVPNFYVVVYILAFSRSIWTEVDAERFQELLARRRLEERA